MMKTGTDMLDKSEAWERLERLLGKARSASGAGEALSEEEAMRLAVQAIRDVRRNGRPDREDR